MPTDMSIPSMVNYYLELIEKLSVIAAAHDTRSIEAELIKIEIEYNLALIRLEMAALSKEINGYKDEV